jgi:signal transduction histidine kinase
VCRIVREALHNVIKHSGVLDAEVQLTGTASHELQLRVADSGSGTRIGVTVRLLPGAAVMQTT